MKIHVEPETISVRPGSKDIPEGTPRLIVFNDKDGLTVTVGPFDARNWERLQAIVNLEKPVDLVVAQAMPTAL